jgi:hypothetical protein
MVQYLLETQIVSQLRANRSIEQWLGNHKEGDMFIIRYVTLHNDRRDGCYCWYGDYEDVGNEGYCDIYSFYTLDEDNEYGNKVQFDSIDDMLQFCYEQLKASPTKFVGSGMLQDVYLEYLKTR